MTRKAKVVIPRGYDDALRNWNIVRGILNDHTATAEMKIRAIQKIADTEYDEDFQQPRGYFVGREVVYFCEDVLKDTRLVAQQEGIRCQS